MEIKIYDRKTKEVVIEKQYKEGHLKFLYNTVIGRVLLKYIFARKYFSGIYAKFMISKRSVKKIKPFIEKFNIDMNEYEGAEYKSFNDFFIRKRTYLAPLFQCQILNYQFIALMMN
jgi:phosphatidylserine decarboxylase